MARKVLTLLQDDVDGSEASETVAFGIDGTSYEIDLNTAHAKMLRATLAPFIASGRRVSDRPFGSRGAARGATSSAAGRQVPAPAVRTETPVDPAAVRAWAAAHRIKVSPRGRVPASVVVQFRAAGH